MPTSAKTTISKLTLGYEKYAYSGLNVTETDLSSIDGPSNGWGFDRLFFELDPKNGDILF